MKTLLLTKANLRKNKGLSIGISILIFVISLLLSASLIIEFDFLKDPQKHREHLNVGDTTVLATRNLENLDEDFFMNVLKDDVEDASVTTGVGIQYAVKYSGGTVTPFVFVSSKERVDNNKIGKTDVVIEDNSITSNYCYVPYQFYSSGGYNLKDTFTLEMPGKNYEYQIKGFTNNFALGSYNTGNIILLIEEPNLQALENEYEINKTISAEYKLKEGVDAIKFTNRLNLEISKVNPRVQFQSIHTDAAEEARTYISMVFIGTFLINSVILLVVALMMISNIVSNHIKQNMKNIGVLKAVGYQSKTIKLSLILQFAIIALIGIALGSSSVYLLMPILSNMLVAQYGMPYTASFSFPALAITVVSLLSIILLLTMFFTRKIGKIEALTALKEGIEIHNFKKNVIPLSKGKLGLNLSLALKSFFNNIKQHIITFFVLLFLTFGGVICTITVENFGINPNTSLLTFESCSGLVSCDVETKDELYSYLQSRDDMTNVKFLVQIHVIDTNDYDLSLYLIDDVNKLNNKSVCYKGRLPQYDNEVVISGKYAKDKGLSIGDSINLRYGEGEYNYLISGLCQTPNNSGREALLSTDAFHHLKSTDHFPGYYWFDTTSDIKEVLNEIKDKFGSHITSTVDFEEALSGSIKVFQVLSYGMMSIILTLSVSIILLVLYLLMKNLIFNKRFEYGVLKSMGFVSRDLILQNAISFMPSIILGTIISCIVSSFLANPYMTAIMSIFGIMQANMVVPVYLVILLAIFEIGISFGISVLLSKKIKKIEPYKLLVGE